MSDGFQKMYDSGITSSHLYQRVASPSVVFPCLFNSGEGPLKSLLILLSFAVLLNLSCEFQEPLLPSIKVMFHWEETIIQHAISSLVSFNLSTSSIVFPAVGGVDV